MGRMICYFICEQVFERKEGAMTKEELHRAVDKLDDWAMLELFIYLVSLQDRPPEAEACPAAENQ